jgi:hypothetical protein
VYNGFPIKFIALFTTTQGVGAVRNVLLKWELLGSMLSPRVIRMHATFIEAIMVMDKTTK